MNPDWDDDDEALAVLRRHRVMPTEGAVRMVRMGLDARTRRPLWAELVLSIVVSLAVLVPLLLVLS